MEMQPEEGYELFRLAILKRDDSAWAAIRERYHLLMIAWARQSSVELAVSEQYDDIADQALAKAWAALNPTRFAEFNALAPLLAYLRSCVMTVQIDMARAQATRERTLQQIQLGSVQTPEEIVLDEMEQAELWALVYGMVASRQEEVILRENIVMGSPPRHLLARHEGLFRSIDEVYATKRNLLNRLGRSASLRRMAEEIRSGDGPSI